MQHAREELVKDEAEQPTYAALLDSASRAVGELVLVIQQTREHMNDEGYNAREAKQQIEQQLKSVGFLVSQYIACADRTLAASPELAESITREKEMLASQTKFMDRAWYELKCALYEVLFVGK
jgi:exonuclease VII large subunit